MSRPDAAKQANAAFSIAVIQGQTGQLQPAPSSVWIVCKSIQQLLSCATLAQAQVPMEELCAHIPLVARTYVNELLKNSTERGNRFIQLTLAP